MAGIRRFGLVGDGDHVLVGLSGGKDSLALTELLGEAARRSGGRFRVTALHVRMAGVDYRTDTDWLAQHAEAAGVALLVKTARFEPDRREGRPLCFLCSWHRRKLLFDTAQELGCGKVALGHHQDDILRTALMNLTFAGTFGTMPAKLVMRKFPVTIVRPLCMVAEADLRAWAAMRGYRPVVKVCPHEGVTNRTRIGAVMAEMERLSPEARHSLWHALMKAGALVDDGGTGAS